MFLRNIHAVIFRATSWLAITALLTTSLPLNELVAAVVEQQKAQPKVPPPARPVRVNRSVPKVVPIPAFPTFSRDPKDDEIARARVFEEPLVPMGGPTRVEENRSLAAAVLAYLKAGNTEDLAPLEAFLQIHPQSPWRVSLLTNMGIVYRRTGYFSRALPAWEKAWTVGKNESDPAPKAIADRAVAEWAELNARLGRYDILEPLFQELDGRDIGGSANEKLRGAKQGLWLMLNKPGEAFRCGPMALGRILALTNERYDLQKIKDSQSTRHGMSLPQVLTLSQDLGMDLQMAKRQVGAPVLLPAVIHWKVGHYAALVQEENGRYLVQDPTFGEEFWISRAALDEQSSGYFLVGKQHLPEGWQSVGAEEGSQVWGKGATQTDDPRAVTPDDENECPECDEKECLKCDEPRGMARYNFHLMLTSLNITDMPVGYNAPRGPAVEFLATYNYRESFQPAIFSYSNLGPKWTFDWLSYVKDDPSNPTSTLYLYVRGGGENIFTWDSVAQSYKPEFRTRAQLVRTSTSPIKYERRLSDGSVEVFAQADGAGSFPRKIFMTEWKDPDGNKLTFTYDASLRLTAVTDAIGQVTTLAYELGSDPLKITKVTDPFGRFATFEYAAAGRLSRITDTIGIQSQFSYSSGDFISSMTTPYGTTRFLYSEPGGASRIRWLEAIDPMGGTERVEFRHHAPGVAIQESSTPTGLQIHNDYLNLRNTYYWDKRAWSLYPGDYTKAMQYHFLHSDDVNVTSGFLESVKPPLESRIWYDYPGQVGGWAVGTTGLPIKIGRVLDDGTTQLYQYEYNLVGNVTKATDPVGRETVYVYGTNNVADPDPATGTSVDLLEVKQKNGGSYDVLQGATYNVQHLPLTVTDAARRVTTFTYRSSGDLETILTPPRGGLSQAQRTTTFQYYADNATFGPGRLQRITGPVTGATTDFAYDGYGRVRTMTESDGYAVTTDYDTFDRPTQITFPDGTSEQRIYNRLDLSETRDRLGRWTHYFYDALRRLVLTRDPMGQNIAQQWCNCGSLDKLIDANGNAITWERDAQNRITKEIRADNSFTQYVYETTTSRLKRRTDPKGQHRDTTYFKDNTVQQMSYPNASPATASVNFTYDPVYDRVATMVDGTGTTTWTYHPVTTAGTLGATQLATVDGPLSNDLISYSYDELGRALGRSINSVAASQTYDVLGRTDSVSNVLGTFNYTYVNQTGRLQSVTYPNGQATTYTYFPNTGDRRLQEILNQKTGAITISKFNYTYDAVGNITTWTQLTDNNPAKAYDLAYDRADRLTGATWRTTDPTPTILKRYGYAYDSAGNRTTEQIDDVPLKASYNNVNRLLAQDPGGTTRFAGTLSEAAKVTVQSKPATVAADNKFSGTATLASGTNAVDVQATDYSGNVRTNTYQVNVSGTTKSFTHDSNGNMTGDGARTFEWDAENRLLAINNGTHRSEFTYDGLSRRVRIIEKDNSVPTSDVRFVWCEKELCEERDSTGSTTTKRFFAEGEQQSIENLFYTHDHLDSVREVTDTTAILRARYDYDSYGRLTKIAGDKDSAFGFTGHYIHNPSGLALTMYRAYYAGIGRWITEDPIGLSDGLNLYNYVSQNPIGYADALGLAKKGGRGKGERGRTGTSQGTTNPYKGWRPDPKIPGRVIKPTPDGKGASIPASKEFIDSWNKKYPDKPWPPPSKSGKAPTGKAPKVKGPKNSLGGGAAANCLFILGYLASVVEITVALQEYERCKKDPCNCNPDLCT